MIFRYYTPVVFFTLFSVVALVFQLSEYTSWSSGLSSQTLSDNQAKRDVPVSDLNSYDLVARDLDDIQAGGTLKILIPQVESLADMSPIELELLTGFAASLDIDYEWVVVPESDSVFEHFAAGQGDMIALLDKGISMPGFEGISFTLPWGVSSQQVIGRAGGNHGKSRTDLTVRQIALKKSSPAWPVLSELSKAHPGMELLLISENTEMNDLLEQVKTGRYDLAVVDSLALPDDLQFYYQLQVLMDLTDETYMSWAVRTDATVLHQALNNFLNKRHLELEVGKSFRDDFPSIQKRRQLRMITTQSPVNYFYDRGRFKGFEYELISKFAEKHRLRLDVVIANSHEQMQEWLQTGKGDIIAASISENVFDEATKPGISRPYNYTIPVLVGREDDSLIDYRDLEGRTVVLSAASPYLEIMQRIKAEGINLSILIADEELNSDALLFRLSQGIYDLTVIGSHEINAGLSLQLNLKAQFNLTDPQALVWAVRKSSPLLLTELNDFIEAEYRKGFYNVLYARYIDKPVARMADSRLFTQLDQLSPYDEIVHKYSDIYNFDWRLIIAQIYQESRFNPHAVSKAGAEGLMQLLPDTATIVGISEVYDPDRNIYGGIRYLDYLRSRFEEDLAPEDRTWFTLAAYNAGYGRVRSARQLAEKMNLDSNKWFDNVEVAMLSLARPFVREGELVRLCRCGQTVVYVREIKTLYKNYLRLTQSARSVATVEQQAKKI